MSISIPRGLAARFLASMLGVTVIAMVLSMLFLHHEFAGSSQQQTAIAESALQQERDQAERLQAEALASKAEILGLFMARTAPDLLLTYDMDLLARYQDVAAGDEDIAYAVYLDPDGNPLLQLPDRPIDVIETRYPVRAQGELLGYVLVGLSTTRLQNAKQVAGQRIQSAIDETLATARRAQSEFIEIQSLAALLMLLGMGLLFHYMFRHLVLRRLRHVNAIARGIADGELDQTVNVRGTDEIGQLGTSMSVMIENLRHHIAETRRRADAATRIRMALDVCRTNVVVADDRHQVIYANQSSTDSLAEAGASLRQELEGFDPERFVGTELARFHADPARREQELAALGEPLTEDVQIGPCWLRLTSTPVFNDHGERLGTAVEWVDRSTEVARLAVEQEQAERNAREAAENLRIRVALDNVSSSVMVADNEQRIVYQNHAAQNLFANAEADIRADMPTFRAAALAGGHVGLLPLLGESDHFDRTDVHQSEFDLGGRTLHLVTNPVVDAAGKRMGTALEWRERTQEVMVEREVAGIVDAARQGDLSHRIGITDKQGFFRGLGAGINALIDEVDAIFTEMARVMEAMAGGDLRQAVNRAYHGSFDELKNNVNGTLNNLRVIVRGLAESVADMRASAHEIAAGNQDLTARTEEQASRLQRTADSMAQLTTTVRTNADSARRADGLALDARGKAQQGGEVVNDAVRAMQAINASSKQIAEIIGVIDGIAFQTNLLALNASVEAARAGEQGRGFAVVATEVRNLASRSAAAAKEIAELIRDAEDKVRLGTDLVNRSGGILGELVQAVANVGDIVAEITTAGAEQSAGIDQVNQAVAALDDMTQQNAALAEQIAAASSALTEKTAQAGGLIARFQL